MPNMWYIHSDTTIVTIAIYYIILRTIQLAIITMIERSSAKFLTIQETMIRIDCNQLGIYS